MTGTVRITITYPTPGTQPDIDAVKGRADRRRSVLVADFSSESTPGKVVFTIDAASGPVVAAAIADARRAAGPGWTTSITTAPPPAWFDPRMFVPSPDGHVRG
jgi:hypothetical protein